MNHYGNYGYSAASGFSSSATVSLGPSTSNSGGGLSLGMSNAQGVADLNGQFVGTTAGAIDGSVTAFVGTANSDGSPVEGATFTLNLVPGTAGTGVETTFTGVIANSLNENGSCP